MSEELRMIDFEIMIKF